MKTELLTRVKQGSSVPFYDQNILALGPVFLSLIKPG